MSASNYFDRAAGTDEAKRHLAQWQEQERQKEEFGQTLLDAYNEFSENDSRSHVDPGALSTAEAEALLEQARESTRAWCAARNRNLRPVRPVDPNDPFAVEGQAQGLAFIERLRLSKIRR